MKIIYVAKPRRSKVSLNLPDTMDSKCAVIFPNTGFYGFSFYFEEVII